MSLTAKRFGEFFETLYGKSPFPWQRRLADDLSEGRWPDCIDLPTASGKTSVIDIGVFTLACQAGLSPDRRTVGRRIFFTVNRRVIVDEAFERSKRLKAKLRDANEGILKEVADALRAVGGDDSLPLDVAQLRGGIYRDRAWARSLTQPMVVCTTADQLGSRLLFRGYGVSPSMQPIHAALTACDSVILLDEAHVTKAFSQTLRLIQRYQQYQPGLRFVEMTATPSGGVARRFELDADDRANPVLHARQAASKPAVLINLNKKKSIDVDVVEHALRSLTDTHKAVGIIVNRVQTARDIEAKLRAALEKKMPDAQVHLVIGRMRPLDRDELQKQLRALVGPDRPDTLAHPVFVVATQCLEVGADYDFDVLITECASIDALRQRFGRLNRRGRPIEAAAAIVTNDESIKGEDPIYGDALKNTWEWLWSHNNENGRVDFGVTLFKPLWEEVERERATYLDEGCPKSLLAPAPNAAVLLPAHLDALCQTKPQPVPSPDVSYFIHGPRRDNAEVNVCWRADLGDDPALWAEIVSMIPPTTPECMNVSLHAVRQWMFGAGPTVDADVAVAAVPADRDAKPIDKKILVWRGPDESKATSDPSVLRPGDTIVVRAGDVSSHVLGHLPPIDGVIRDDLAEQATARARRQRVVRVHPAVHPELVAAFADQLADSGLPLRKADVRAKLGPLAAGFTAGPVEVRYPGDDRVAGARGILFRFAALLPDGERVNLADPGEDDGDDSSTESTTPLLLAEHVADVVRFTQRNVRSLGLSASARLFESAAMFHDTGKADLRFVASLAGVSPYEAVGRPALGKSGDRGLSLRERIELRERALLPKGFRHEMLSTQIVEAHFDALVKDSSLKESFVDRDLLLHLIAAHHGHARPFAPVVVDAPGDDELLGVRVDGLSIEPATRKQWIPAHRLDSGVAERFWDLTRAHGWWGLAYLEAVLRLADQQASALEQQAPPLVNGAAR